MKVELVDTMGSCLSVVNAARVSFDKFSYKLDEKDERLLSYLAEHDHWSPFAHTSLQFRIKAPIFVARQLGKHQVGLSWNEVSRRYVDGDPEFYNPTTWRGKPANDNKQGSDGEIRGPEHSQEDPRTDKPVGLQELQHPNQAGCSPRTSKDDTTSDHDDRMVLVWLIASICQSVQPKTGPSLTRRDARDRKKDTGTSTNQVPSQLAGLEWHTACKQAA